MRPKGNLQKAMTCVNAVTDMHIECKEFRAEVTEFNKMFDAMNEDIPVPVLVEIRDTFAKGASKLLHKPFNLFPVGEELQALQLEAFLQT